jgi:suppressor for copper-sensitivity B
MPKLCLFAGLLTVFGLSLASAQTGLFDNLQGAQAPANTEPLVTVSAAFTADKGSREGQLAITADIAQSWHIYSITQPPGGPVRSKIKLDESPDFKVTGDFKPSVSPKKHVDNDAFKGLTLEEHTATVTWTAPIELAADVEPEKLQIRGKLLAQTCSGSQCSAPEDFPFTGTFDPSLVAKKSASPADGERTANKYEVEDITFSGHVSPRMVVSGTKLTLVITAEPAIGWHIYELGDKPASSPIGSRPTLLVLTETSGLKEGPAVASDKPLRDAKSSLGHHEDAVTWTVEMSVPPRAKRGPIKIRGLLGYQICKNNDGGCKPPDAFGFEANLTLGAQTVDGEVPLEFNSEHRYAEVEKLVKNPSLGTGNAPSKPDAGKSSLFNPEQFKPAGVSGEPSSLAFMMGMGFLGGLILNLMPCVLPVIGLKILSFVEQSGHSRRQSFLLNFWYSLGMLAVFMALATLPVVSRLWFNKQFGWGQQFSYDAFNITLTAIVFVMALSFLGVWEIPIPGFVGGNKAGKLASKEGVAGAFSKGAITTVLATPCSGPFLGSALGFAVAQPPLVTYLMFGSIGVGMASPYLLIGAFPQLLRFLPKPGAWMDTFKQTMGFVLLATVVYLMTLIRWPLMVPTLALLIGLWAACWWIGRTPLYAELPAKARAWTIGAIFATVVGVVAFQSLQPIMQERFQRAVEQEIAAMGGVSQAPASHVSVDKPDRLPWRPFSMQELSALTREGKTVMVDFTADWCVTCKTLENLVLNTAETKQVVMASGIVTMVADMTRYPPEESSLLEKLSGGRLVPVLAIFPAGRPNEPIVLNNAYTKGLLFEKLKEAGPSKGSAQAGALTAMRGR